MAKGVVVGQGGLKPADKAKLTPENLRAGVTIDGVTGNPNVVDTSEGNAAAGQILSGKKAFVDGTLITGTSTDRNGVIITPGVSDQSLSGLYYNGAKVQGDPNLVSSNIKKGQTIFGIAGNSNVVDTSAGNASAAHILSGIKAYVDGNLVTGTMPDRSGRTSGLLGSGYTAQDAHDFNSNTSGYYGYITTNPDVAGYMNTTTKFKHVAYGLHPDVIKVGQRIGNGNSEVYGTYTSDATATDASIFAGKTAYVNGVKVTGSMTNYGSSNLVHNASKIMALTESNGNATVRAHCGYTGYVSTGSDFSITIEKLAAANIKAGVKIGDSGDTSGDDYITGTFTSDANATGSQIYSGKTAYVNGSKVTGTMTVHPSRNAADSSVVSGNELRLSVPTSGYYNDSCYVYNTDNDWIESNIKSGVNIFGKTGTYTGESQYVEGTYTGLNGLTGGSFTLPFAPKVLEVKIKFNDTVYTNVISEYAIRAFTEDLTIESDYITNLGASVGGGTTTTQNSNTVPGYQQGFYSPESSAGVGYDMSYLTTDASYGIVSGNTVTVKAGISSRLNYQNSSVINSITYRAWG